MVGGDGNTKTASDDGTEESTSLLDLSLGGMNFLYHLIFFLGDVGAIEETGGVVPKNALLFGDEDTWDGAKSPFASLQSLLDILGELRSQKDFDLNLTSDDFFETGVTAFAPDTGLAGW